MMEPKQIGGTISPDDCASVAAGEPRKQSMLYEKCEHCSEGIRETPTGLPVSTCRFCKGIGFIKTGATAGQLNYMANLDTLRQEAGISAAMLRDGRARKMVDSQESLLTLQEEVDKLADFAADSLELRIGETNIVDRLNAICGDKQVEAMQARKATFDRKQPLHIILAWCDRNGEEPEGQCLHEIENVCREALGLDILKPAPDNTAGCELAVEATTVMREAIASAVATMRQHLIHASPWGAKVIENLEAAAK